MPAFVPLLPSLRKYKFVEWGEDLYEEFDVSHRLRQLAMCISRMQGLETLKVVDSGLVSCPDCLSLLRGLQKLWLDFHNTNVSTLPGGITNLSRLRKLTLRFTLEYAQGMVGSLNAAAIGSLSCFPCLKKVHLANCMVQFSDELAHAVAHPTLSHLAFSCALPRRGRHVLAVLALHRHMLLQGRQGVSVEVSGQPSEGGEGYAQRLHVYQKLANFKCALSAVEEVE